MLDFSKYKLAKSRTGYWEIRWSEKIDGRYASRSHSTRETERGKAEIYKRHWLNALAEAENATIGLPPVAELCDKYELAAKARGVGITQYRVLAQLRQFFGHLEPNQITDEDLHDYRAHRGVSTGTLRRELNTLVAVLNHAARKKLVPATELPHIDLPPEGQSREVYLSPEEEAKFYELLAKSPAARVSVFCMLALRTGARKAAIEKLTWDRVDLENRFVDYRDPGLRASKKRRVPVPIDDMLLPVLQGAKLFSSGPYVVGGDIKSALLRLRRDNPEFQKVTPHVLRHTAATRWLREGISIWHVAGLLGDTVETTTKVYGHHATVDLREAMSGN